MFVYLMQGVCGVSLILAGSPILGSLALLSGAVYAIASDTFEDDDDFDGDE